LKHNSNHLSPLLECSPHCLMFWNRDVNAARNVRDIFIYSQQYNGGKPSEFQRTVVQPVDNNVGNLNQPQYQWSQGCQSLRKLNAVLTNQPDAKNNQNGLNLRNTDWKIKKIFLFNLSLYLYIIYINQRKWKMFFSGECDLFFSFLIYALYTAIVSRSYYCYCK